MKRKCVYDILVVLEPVSASGGRELRCEAEEAEDIGEGGKKGVFGCWRGNVVKMGRWGFFWGGDLDLDLELGGEEGKAARVEMGRRREGLRGLLCWGEKDKEGEEEWCGEEDEKPLLIEL